MGGVDVFRFRNVRRDALDAQMGRKRLMKQDAVNRGVVAQRTQALDDAFLAGVGRHLLEIDLNADLASKSQQRARVGQTRLVFSDHLDHEARSIAGDAQRLGAASQIIAELAREGAAVENGGGGLHVSSPEGNEQCWLLERAGGTLAPWREGRITWR